jgi:hypothetical protein
VDARPDERHPSVATVPGVGPVLAYMYRSPYQSQWEVRVVGPTFDPETGAPATRPGTDLTLAEGYAPIAPVFAPDGRSVYALGSPFTPSAQMTRLSLSEFPLAQASAPPHAAPGRRGPDRS